jgi:hypothetical protein
LKNLGVSGDSCFRFTAKFNGLQSNSLRDGTGNFGKPSREFLRRKREFAQQSLKAKLRLQLASRPLA